MHIITCNVPRNLINPEVLAVKVKGIVYSAAHSVCFLVQDKRVWVSESFSREACSFLRMI